MTLCAAPLAFGAVEPWAWPLLTLLSLVALGSWGWSCMRQGRVRLFWSSLNWLWVLLLVFGLVQLFSGITRDTFATRNGLILLAGDFALFFVTGQLFAGESSGTYRRFGRLIALYTFGLALFAIIQFFTSHGFLYWSIRPARSSVFGPYVNRDDYAGLMEMLIPIAGAYAFTRRADGSRRTFYLFALAVAVASLFLSGSRGGMVALFCDGLIVAVIALRLTPIRRWRFSAMVGVPALAAGLALSLWMNPGVLSRRMESLANFPLAPELTLGQRLEATRDTLAIFRSHPWLGTGLGSFMIVFPRYQTFADNAIWEHAHDDYAEALAETGLIGGVLLVAGLFLFFRTAFGRLKERLQSSAGWIQLSGAIACCGLLVHSFVDFNLHIPANAAWFSVCLALATVPPVVSRRPVGSSGKVE